MRTLTVAFAVLLLGGCSLFDGRPEYSGPDDYAFTLTVGCFCPYVGPIRIVVRDGEVTESELLDPPEDPGEGTPDTWLEDWVMTLEELSALAARAEREADAVDVTYDATYGFPATLYIDWYRNAVDDEVSYTVRDYTPLQFRG